MKPSIGRIIHYVLSTEDAEQINRRRVADTESPTWPKGSQAHKGNRVSAGEIIPAVIIVAWPADIYGVNAQGFLDGNDSIWLTSIKEGTEPGTWRWPERVE